MGQQLKGKFLVFGNLLDLHNIQVKGKPSDIARLYEEINELEKNVFTAFVSFALSRAGFYNRTIVDLYSWDVADRTSFTTEFKEENWIKHVDAFSCWEEFRKDLPEAEYELVKKYSEWTVSYENDKGKTLNVRFLTGPSFWYFGKLPIYEGKGEKKYFAWIDSYLSEIDRSSTNYIVVHPETYEESKLRFKELNSQLAEKLGQTTLFSANAFLHQLFPDETKKYVVAEGWISVREKILEQVRKKWPIIVFATHAKQLSEINELISSAIHKYGLGEPHFGDAVKDAGVACEGLLRVIYDLYKPKNLGEKPELGELLDVLRDIISGELDQSMYWDLDFIRTWRNKVVHHPIEKPDELTTLQVVEKAKLLYELFSKWSKIKKE